MFQLLLMAPFLVFIPALWARKRQTGRAYDFSMIGGVGFFANLELSPSYARMGTVDVAVVIVTIAWPTYSRRRSSRRELAASRSGT